MMTGRDLILYILKNNLEDKPVFENGRILGFMTMHEAAAKLNVGIATMRAWVDLKRIESVTIGDAIYIPADVELPEEKPRFVKDGIAYYVR